MSDLDNKSAPDKHTATPRIANTRIAAKYQAGSIWVVKIGSSILTAHGKGLDVALIGDLVDQMVEARNAGVQIVLVSSGAVAEGMTRLGLTSRPASLHMLQAAAAVGQMGLIQVYESHFQRHSLHTAQILLTHDDLRSRERYLNARNTLKNLLSLGVIPVVNENDTVVTDEIRFGDNDTLAALVANLIGANTVILLTDQRGLYTSNPDKDADATLIPSARSSDILLDKVAGDGGALGQGGMVTKVNAARMAARSGANTIISFGREANCIRQLLSGTVTGTLIESESDPLVARKQWLAALPARGKLYLDLGAAKVIREDGRSLLAVGVKSVTGDFTRGEVVACIDEAGNELARGLINYNCQEAVALCGQASTSIKSILGYIGDDELIHRDNLVLLASPHG
jgi:glutamate 5-kinase